ncbi:MAG: MBL fold metallo-hydrolase [Opitutaceae bacterium]|nr:MBL fold metallo-hydrolase [Opitutaceae bacterium]
MEIVFLGTGTSQGVPMIGCECDVCLSKDSRNRRTRSSIHVVMDGFHIQVDAAPEFREQCLRSEIPQVDLFILTHGHADHILGMDDLRRYCDIRKGEAIPVLSTEEGIRRLNAVYPYAIGSKPLRRGYPAFDVKEMPEFLETEGGTIRSTILPHGPTQVLGLIFEERSSGKKMVYYTDCKEVGDEQRSLAKGADLVILDGLREESHPTHMSIEEACETALAIGSAQNFLIHMTHTVDHMAMERELPATVKLSYDGLRVCL